MTTLIEILKNETESLRIQYLEMTQNWAKNNFAKMQESKFLYTLNGKYFTNCFGKTKAEDAMINRTASILNKGIEIYLSELKKDAENHYETSILKLATRIEKKGLNVENLKILTSHIGVNIETTLTDGIKNVKAFTIIAEGIIQRPHYRYLIK